MRGICNIYSYLNFMNFNITISIIIIPQQIIIDIYILNTVNFCY